MLRNAVRTEESERRAKRWKCLEKKFIFTKTLEKRLNMSVGCAMWYTVVASVVLHIYVPFSGQDDCRSR
jgi:hypothetical protein